MVHMRNMHSTMMNMKPSNDPDAQFAQMMIIHHQGAINMAQSYLQYGENPRLKRLASNIVSGQSKEIKQLQAELNKEKLKASPAAR